MVLFALGCGEHVRTVHVVDARSIYDGSHREVAGRVLVDATEAGDCVQRWWFPEVVCDVDAELTSTDRLRLEIALDIGSASAEIDLRVLVEGRHVVLLETRPPLFAATVTFDVTVEPWLPLDASIGIAVVLAVALAYGLYLVRGVRFLSNDDPKPRGTAITVARVFAILAQASIVPVAAVARDTEPMVSAVPTLLGSFAASVVLIDAIATRRLGSHRAAILVSSIAAAVALPLIIVATINASYTIALVVVMMLVALF